MGLIRTDPLKQILAGLEPGTDMPLESSGTRAVSSYL